MKAYYEKDGVTIYNGAARSVLADMDPHSIDVVLTDPPFFMPATHYQSRVKWQKSWSDTSVLADFWANIVRLTVPSLNPTGHFLTFCNGESYPVFYPEMYRSFDRLKLLVWDKGHFGLGRVWRNQHELVIAARWAESVFIEDHVARADIFQFAATKSRDRAHPVEKPVDMLAWLLTPVTPKGGVVLDMFGGGGGIIEATRRVGARVIMIEGEERYCEIAAKRAAALPLAA